MFNFQVIKCLKRLSKKHNICVITSIHQPNSDLLLMFDKLYVLSKGGHCVYSGPPQQLSQHLTDCEIVLKKEELPIEVLLKYSCNDFNNENVEQMIKKTKESEKELIRSRSSREVHSEGIEKISKRFYCNDLWILLQRGMTYTLQFYWKIYLFQIIIYIFFGLVFKLLFNSNIGIPSGCVSFDEDFNNTCAKTEAKLEEEDRIITNLKFNFFLTICVLVFTATATILSFSFDIKIFFNEQKNGMFYKLAKLSINIINFHEKVGTAQVSITGPNHSMK